MPDKLSYHVIGLMSGSSLDGLDIAYIRFMSHDSRFTYEMIRADFVEYDAAFRNKIKQVANGTAFELAQLHTELGKYFGKLTKDFINKHKINKLDLVVSHGQTIFHQPGNGFTTQIGCGAQIAALTNCKTVSDLRTTDLAYGGQAAPIVPIAEKYLFREYKAFLNLGGIANLSFRQADEKVIAYDVCACNTLLNHLAQQKGTDFDKNGDLARSGKIIPELLNELNEIAFCKQTPPKSLGTEHIVNDWLPLFEKYKNSNEDKLSTAVEHIATVIGSQLNPKSEILNPKLLVTGGGALNQFLVERIQQHSSIVAIVPDEDIVQYKEALAMAFIGLLRYLEIPNVLASVTGASKNSIGGAIYLP